ncbi:hypothetical protein [Dongshaea marina]|uniref:hypothetical protein n=1 Tax=Dongshaea marina TaxID=2047966 RepID=UPI000D3E3885|nr:hypothetical protein [Dongshaea marina]
MNFDKQADPADPSNTLHKLYDELDQRLSQQLADIEKSYQARARQLKQEKMRSYKNQLTKLQQSHDDELRQLQLKSTRESEARQQQSLWQCQQACIDEIIAMTRDVLLKQAPDLEQLKSWIEQASSLQTRDPSWELKIPLQWAERINAESFGLKQCRFEHVHLTKINTSTGPMLGGAILQNPKMHIEIDGSWDHRLQILTSELWQRWLKDVSPDDQD